MGLLDVLRRLRRGRPRGSLVVCPRCGSPRVRRLPGLYGWLLPAMYACPDCGYRVPLVLELVPEAPGERVGEEGERREAEGGG